jgi:hypothetical protein
MTLARYFVFQQDGAWIVAFEGQVMARFPGRGAALDKARGMANLMGAMHYDADVMLDDDGTLRQVWAYGRDQLKPPIRRSERPAAAQPPMAALPRDHSLAPLTL